MCLITESGQGGENTSKKVKEELPEKGEEAKYGLNIDKIQLNLALILRGAIPDLKRIVDGLEKESGIFVVYKKVGSGRFSVQEEQPY